jgi:ABC-type multidrug transport system fused ATPase/permease subunit
MHERLVYLVGIVVAMAGASAVAQLIDVVQGRTAVDLTHNLAHRLRVQLYQHLQMLSLRFYDKQRVGSLHTRVSQDTHEMESILVVFAQQLLSNLLMLVAIACVLCALDWRLFLAVMAPVPIVVVVTQWAWKRIDRAWPRWWRARHTMNAYLNESISGVRVVRAFAQHRHRELS